MRATTGVASRRRHKRVIKAAKGYRAIGKRYKTAKQAVMKAGLNAYRGRKEKKRVMRALWVKRISNALLPFGINYSTFMGALASKGIVLNRKMISEIAIQDAAGFEKLVKDSGATAKTAAPKKETKKAAPKKEEVKEEAPAEEKTEEVAKEAATEDAPAEEVKEDDKKED